MTAIHQPCRRCAGVGQLAGASRQGGRSHRNPPWCPRCGGRGYRGVDPGRPCPELAGTLLRIAYYAARVEAGLPLHDPRDARRSLAETPGQWSAADPDELRAEL